MTKPWNDERALATAGERRWRHFVRHGPQGLWPEEWHEINRVVSLFDEDDPWRFSLPHQDRHFSARHLEIQLNQETDQGARRLSEQIHLLAWLKGAGFSLDGKRVLQPLCGPGVTADAIRRVADIESYLGIDLGPAQFEHARSQFSTNRFGFSNADITTWENAGGNIFDIVLLIYEAANAFPKEKLQKILARLAAELRADGALICEIRPCEASNAWPPAARRVLRNEEGGLFSPVPHDILEEQGTLPDHRHAGHQYLIAPLRTGRVETIHRSTLRLYYTREFAALLTDLGLDIVFEGKPFVDRESDITEARANAILVGRKR